MSSADTAVTVPAVPDTNQTGVQPVQSPTSTYITLYSPWALALMSLLILGLVAVTNHGVVPTDLLNFLETIIVTATAGGTVTGVSHGIVNGVTQREVLRAEILKNGKGLVH